MSRKPSSSPSCPICGTASIKKYAPFCSVKCADRDLAKWLGGNYAIPAADDDEDTLDEIEQIETPLPQRSNRVH